MNRLRLHRVKEGFHEGVVGDLARTVHPLRDVHFGHRDYPAHLRRIRFKEPESGKTLIFLTNNFALPAATVYALYKARWQVEFFFKWIKQHLRIQRFSGTSENSVKSQIWIAVSVYVLVAIVKKHLHLDASLYTLLQILSVTLLEKMPLQQAFTTKESSECQPD